MNMYSNWAFFLKRHSNSYIEALVCMLGSAELRVWKRFPNNNVGK